MASSLCVGHDLSFAPHVRRMSVLVAVAGCFLHAINAAAASYKPTLCSPALVSTGLKNLGNTCYMNAQLQCAYHIPRIRQLITADPILGQVGKGAPAQPSVALQALRQVFEQMEQSSREPLSAPPVSPRVLAQNMGINPMQQEDSQEFWKLFLPALEHTQLMDLYSGAFEDYITAVDGSGRERKREEPFLDLSLDVTCHSVLASIESMFGTPELLTVAEGNGWRPEKGAGKVDALKGSLLRMQGLPSILQLHLKRFQYDWQTDSMRKINDRFSFPKDLNLSSVCIDVENDKEANALYALQSVVVHVGGYGSGHYYSYVRPDIRSNLWFRFNDHEVTKVKYREVINDAFGGSGSHVNDAKQKGFWGRMLSSHSSLGWGGKTSNAYMLQYARRIDIPMLYNDDQSGREFIAKNL